MQEEESITIMRSFPGLKTPYIQFFKPISSIFSQSISLFLYGYWARNQASMSSTIFSLVTNSLIFRTILIRPPGTFQCAPYHLAFLCMYNHQNRTSKFKTHKGTSGAQNYPRFPPILLFFFVHPHNRILQLA